MKQKKSEIAKYPLYSYRKDNEGVKVESFMMDEMQLKGYELLLYAMIYGYFREGDPFTMSRISVAKILGCSTRTLSNAFDLLLTKGYIYKVGKAAKGVVEYAINIEHLPDIPMHSTILRLYREEKQR